MVNGENLVTTACFSKKSIYWIVYHAYDAKQIGIPKLRIESISWDADGWPFLPSQGQQPQLGSISSQLGDNGIQGFPPISFCKQRFLSVLWLIFEWDMRKA
jgi:hypothetical protein